MKLKNQYLLLIDSAPFTETEESFFIVIN